MFYLVLPTAAARDSLIAHLAQRQIQSVFHYVPLHLSPMGRRFGRVSGGCPVTEDVSVRLLRLPFYNNMTTDEHDRIIDAVVSFRPE